MKITKIKEDITSEIANSIKNSVAIDTEATGLQIPQRDSTLLFEIKTSLGIRLDINKRLIKGHA